MRALRNSLKAIGRDCRAVTMLEYAIMGAVIVAALVTAVPPMTTYVSSAFNLMANRLEGTS